jgi:hypothetical protein
MAKGRGRKSVAPSTRKQKRAAFIRAKNKIVKKSVSPPPQKKERERE